MSRSVFSPLLLLLLGTVVACAIAELVLRQINRPWLGWQRQPCIYQESQTTGYRYKPGSQDWMIRNIEIENLVKINSRGSHDNERVIDESAFRIAVLGDSFTAALHVPVEHGWTQILEKTLENNTNRKIDVFNLGLDGTGTNTHLQILKEQFDSYRPHLVILSFYENDFRDSTRGLIFRTCHKGYVLSYRNEYDKIELVEKIDSIHSNALLPWLFHYSYIFRFAVFKTMGEKHPLRNNFFVTYRRDENRRSEKEVGPELIEQLHQLSLDKDFKVVIAAVPTTHSDAHFKRAVTDLPYQMHYFAALPAVHSLLKRDNRRQSDLHWQFDSHFNSYGNQLFGLAAAEHLLSHQELLSAD